MDSRQLLSDYARNGAETAFEQLLTRYIGLVYSTALRLVDGDTHRPEDVAQTVFTDLARQAARLSGCTILRCSPKAVKTRMYRARQQRQQLRERLAPILVEYNETPH